MAIRSHGLPVGLCVFWQSLHEFLQLGMIISAQISLEGMSQPTLQAAFPTLAAVVQISAPSGQFAGFIDIHSLGCAYDAQHLPFGQDLAASHAGPLRGVFHTWSRFLFHFQRACSNAKQKKLPVFTLTIISTFVLLASNDFTEVFIEHQLDALLLAFLSFFLVIPFFLTRRRILEDLGFHLEQLIE